MMNKFGAFALIFYLSASFSQAQGQNADVVSRADCGLTFLVPKALEYIEIENPVKAGDDLCYIAFNDAPVTARRSSNDGVAVPSDWRNQVDFSLTVKSIPLARLINSLDSPDSAQQKGLYRLISDEHIRLNGGDLHILTLIAPKPTSSMIRLKQTRKTILVAGDDTHSLSVYLYSAKSSTKQNYRFWSLRRLFSSLHFYTVK